MKLFLIAHDELVDCDSYDSAVVASPDEETARQMDPSTGLPKDWSVNYSTWCSGPAHVTVRYLGEAADDAELGIVCASFNAG